jgi:hypothetical protein
MLSIVEHPGTTHTLKGDITAFLELEICSGRWGEGRLSLDPNTSFYISNNLI